MSDKTTDLQAPRPPGTEGVNLTRPVLDKIRRRGDCPPGSEITHRKTTYRKSSAGRWYRVNPVLTGRRRVGAPTLLSPEVTQRFVEAFEVHLPIHAACEYAGVSTKTYARWRGRALDALEERDRIAEAEGIPPEDVGVAESEAIYVVFWETVRAARAKSTRTLAQLAHSHAVTDGRIALEILARRDPQNWAKSNRVELSGGGGGEAPIRFYLPAQGETDGPNEEEEGSG